MDCELLRRHGQARTRFQVACPFVCGRGSCVTTCCVGPLRADTVPARNDFVCMIGCVSGRDAVLKQNASVTLNESYFNPPYMVNNGDNLYNISYKTVAVTASHYDGTLVRGAGACCRALLSLHFPTHSTACGRCRPSSYEGALAAAHGSFPLGKLTTASHAWPPGLKIFQSSINQTLRPEGPLSAPRSMLHVYLHGLVRGTVQLLGRS